ncbi:MAG: hypothetical protein CL831_09010 [Crocinitomicaceae bacterium]|nr:hypothetical protein [Crocinitomicaceae bacterium]
MYFNALAVSNELIDRSRRVIDRINKATNTKLAKVDNSRLVKLANHQGNKIKEGDIISQRVELKFFIFMTITFFILPLLVMQIPGIEMIGEAILNPFMKIIDPK